jgi:immune inhibitor A
MTPRTRGLLAAAVALAVVATTGLVLRHPSAPASSPAVAAAAGFRPVGRLHVPPMDEVARLVRADGHVGPNAGPEEVAAAASDWLAGFNVAARHVNDAQALATERQVQAGAGPAGALPFTVHILAVPVQFGASERLSYQVQSADRSQCITVTNTFSGPMHGQIPYPGGSPTTTRDNETVWYPSTEPEDYTRLIFGRTGYTRPVRAGDPNVNGGHGVDLTGLTVESYFLAQSDGAVTITGTVAAWATVPHSEAYYGLDVCVPRISAVAMPDQQLGSFADLAIQAAESTKARGGEYGTYAFWKRFDENGDGVLDALWLIHGGRGQEYGGGPEGAASIWSRAADVRDYGEYPDGYVIHDNGTPDPSDDLRLGPFTLLPEDSDIGVLIEEFGHSTFELPDLYTMNSSNSVGWWAPMSAGIWGGELGGTQPVNMPLWFRQVATCHGQPCGWANPVKVLPHDTAPTTVVLGQAGTPAGGTVASGAHAGQTIYEGLQVNLPDQQVTIPNRAGTGGGAWSSAVPETGLTLERELDLTTLGQDDVPILSFDSSWLITRYWGYAYVEASTDGGKTYTTLPDTTGFFTDDNPYGLNEGYGLTGTGSGKPQFDLHLYRGQKIHLRFRYFTYQGSAGTGWWLDNLRVVAERAGASVTLLADDFETGLGAWAAQGWRAVPLTEQYPQHYLVEWRNANGFDRALRLATSTSFQDPDEWRVDRVPANVPGAVVMYRNFRYPFSGAFRDNLKDPPSYGSKYGLLVVDPNFWPTQRPSGQAFAGRLESLEAALALQAQPDYTLEVRDPATGAVQRTDSMVGRPGASRFDDAHGYYPGYRLDAEGKPTIWDEDASVVVPSRDGKTYSTRATHADRSPATEVYGQDIGNGQFYGTGDPADAGAQLGLRIEVVDAAPDGSWGAVRVYNAGVDYTLEASAPAVLPGREIVFTVRAHNFGTVAATANVSVTLPAGFTLVSGDLNPGLSVEPGQTLGELITARAPAVLPAEAPRAQAVFDDGTDRWLRSVTLGEPRRAYLPMAVTGVPLP